MKYNFSHFKFTTKARRFKTAVWTKYYSLKKKKKLEEFDKYWMKQFRAELKTNQFKLIAMHIPTKTEAEWTVKNKEKLNRKEYLAKLILKVQEARKTLKAVKSTTKTFDGASYSTVGNVFVWPNSIIPLAANLTTNDPMAQKKPRHAKKNYIGIELEFNTLPGVTQETIAAKLKKTGLARYVDVTTDGSCGWEVRVLLLEEEFAPILTKICTVLDSMGFKTDEKCGTHVHFDMRNRDVKVVYENLFKTQKFLRKFITRNRKFNRFCKMNKASTFEEQSAISDRYYSINTQSYGRHKTLEVRAHQGTLNAGELIPWINFLLRVVNYKNTVEKTIATLKQAKVQFDIDETLGQSLEEKIRSLAKVKKSTTVLTGSGIGSAFNYVISNVTGSQ